MQTQLWTRENYMYGYKFYLFFIVRILIKKIEWEDMVL